MLLARADLNFGSLSTLSMVAASKVSAQGHSDDAVGVQVEQGAARITCDAD
jgi:hypothetical protein